MINWSLNLSMLPHEVPFLERFQLAADWGFGAVEFTFPYEFEPAALAVAVAAAGVRVVLFNLPAGDVSAGERGIACDPDREREFGEGVERVLEYARLLRPAALNCLVGIPPPGLERQLALTTAAGNLRRAARRLAPLGIRLLTEPLNTVDVPGFLLSSTREAFGLLQWVGEPRVGLQYDVYHMQIMEGDLVRTLRAAAPVLGHVQIADVPGRHEPGSGEINYPFVLRELAATGYSGHVGLEYVPDGGSAESLLAAGRAGLWQLGLPRPPRGTAP